MATPKNPNGHTGQIYRKMRREMIAEARECAICHGPLKKDAHYLDPAAPQLDYVIPVSAGGSHGRGNARIVHRWCNQSKWNKMPAAVVREPQEGWVYDEEP